MSRPGGWWGSKSTPAKVETYTRWSFHSFALVEFVAAGGPVIGRFGHLGPRLAAPLLLMIAVHCALCTVTASRALDWVRGQREQPLRLLWALGAVSAVVTVAAVATAEHGPASRDVVEAVAGILMFVPCFGVGIVALGVRSRPRVFGWVAGFAVGTGLVSLPFGMPAPAALLFAVGMLLGGGFIAFTSVFSVWLLKAVYELDEARETRTRLAVAEERLRFGRDLHDVMGRNLAVIALKSELAVQLAQRERPEAVTQMVEVQRLAHEAQREVREVVRGYREADLGSELAGARGVLDAAGIDCTVTGSTTGLPAQVQSALGWVVREAVTNVLRHGDARRCVVGIRVLKGQTVRTVLTVENDGVPENGGSGRGTGLVGLRERLAEIGGTLRAGPTGDGRFLLTAEVPLPSAAGSGASPSGESTASPAPRTNVSEVMP
ncbi:sensor histidine kinase [Streptomyces sp. M2CJ-2]|uniref:sensor histidine kinase n=1 Tax=Streptomyces sp. M2CJ-2 TaxID=2803948 RepID=UPI00192174AD|nr:histidine kinase [Streptomyces sp. M2CJ-2]MBL3665203.1 sensor histidine kinase [Streptomyces sp. M2CJ-2]